MLRESSFVRNLSWNGRKSPGFAPLPSHLLTAYATGMPPGPTQGLLVPNVSMLTPTSNTIPSGLWGSLGSYSPYARCFDILRIIFGFLKKFSHLVSMLSGRSHDD